MNLVLIGYRGAGKSSVAKIVASRLSRPAISTDAEIIARAKCSIPDFVRQFGWDRFRDLESDVCREVSNRNGLVIDTGGGIILREQNIKALKANGRLFWLTAEVETIRRRIGDDTHRPSLTGGKSFTDEIEEVLRERGPIYQAAADDVIATDGRRPVEVAEAVFTRFKEVSGGVIPT